MSIRLFVGLSIPSEIAQRLYMMQGGIEGARWTHKDDYHITLSFIGDVDKNTAEDIDDILSQIRFESFQLRLMGLGSFSQGDDPKVLWAGVDHSDMLHRLHEKIHAAFLINRITVEKRKYVPHVTLARFRHPDEETIITHMQSYADYASDLFHVAAFHLYESLPGSASPRYNIVKDYSLI